MMNINDYNFNNKRALIRVDFNVPLNENLQITDDTRIRAAIPTIKRVTDMGGSVILMSHLGRPKGEVQEKFSLRYIVNDLSNRIGKEVKFVSDSIGEEVVTASENLSNGEILLLENLRFYNEETKGDPTFAKKLANLGDVYVNDAFGTAHRAHASTAVVASYFDKEAKLFGYVIEKDDKRVYISVDTEDIPEMRNLADIDIAFICMNLPYTMTVESAASAVLDFKPETVFPYHYRGTEGLSDVSKFKELVNNGDSSINVTQLDWYPTAE